jgi:hypothetical protein
MKIKNRFIYETVLCDLAGTRTQDPPDKNWDALPTELLNASVNENKKPLHLGNGFFVIWLGLEPRTHTLKVYCSTN